MFYSFQIAIPANTTQNDAIETDIKLTQGVIYNVQVQFPIGCKELAHCQIYREGSQKWPTNPEANLASDGYIIPISEEIELLSAPYTFKAKTWNEDDTYDHTITIWIGVLRGRSWQRMAQIFEALARFMSKFGVQV